ncbi:Mur ligase family protein [Mammaliicoccus sciuri]|uniref:Mur ligase family protein n=1 Tax=Mammaliicoccus sciuri TaxID=1296 RepID=UPI00065B5BAF|nr:Mur ligase family protein [Mammaliicoccus sciuri]MDQ7131246.1 Mur ligase family protein [Mammaliicoccus sciuri]PNY97170.1 UDP-N-acetylmuramoylalanyl-D-glutamate--2,6-diaminopimelate ligase [Mammaliicoccus sciuri]WRY63332.1 Mur ligase family protein [Mammaliicoccus sciuri]SQE47751.1 UDP-N-acetylmuramoylalanyl-D-glutamate--L-lysine ligase [Mammaliicoccus sciuri]
MKILDVISQIEQEILVSNNNYKINIDKECTDITTMYQNIKNSSIFILKASNRSKIYAEKAISKNPILILTNMEANSLDDMKCDIPVIYLSNYASAINKLVHLFYDKYIESLKFIAVTGTNGKTTTSHMVGKILSKLDKRVAVVGTLGVYDSKFNKMNFNHSTPTTPMHIEFAEIIKYFAEKNYDYIVYEATSIALDQKRVNFIYNELAIFTNFSSEHLEYHHTLENYLEAKLKLNALSKKSIVNYDSEEYRKIGYDRYHFSNNQKNDMYYKYSIEENKLSIWIDGNVYQINIALNGIHNYINLAISIFAIHKLNFDIKNILEVVKYIKPPDNRFEIFKIREFEFILDFAHTPLAINESISEAIKYSSKKRKKLTVMITGIGLRGLDKIRDTMNLIPNNIDQIILASEQVGFENENHIIATMIKYLPEYYDLNNIMIASSRKEAIKKIVEKTKSDESIILLTGINEPQHYRGDLINHDDKSYIKICINNKLV